VPDAHVTWNLWGENYTNSSILDNVIAVYQGVSFREQEFTPTPDEVIEVSSGEDFSNFVDANGFALEDIKVTNDTLNVFVFIPKGTRIRDANRIPLTNITIKPIKLSESPPDHSNFILAGEMLYQLGPKGAYFTPHVNINFPLNTSMTGTPMIYRYNTSWDSFNSKVDWDRISANLTNFSVYGVFIEAEDTSPEISKSEILMSAKIRSAISIEVTPDKLDFGKLAPGDTSNRNNITIKNFGTCTIYVTTDVADEKGNLYKQGLDIDGNSCELFNVTVVKNILKTPYIALNVPKTYEGVGSKTGTLIFWAEGVN